MVKLGIGLGLGLCVVDHLHLSAIPAGVGE